MIGLGASQIIIACRNVEKGKTAARYLQELTECAQDAIQVWQLDMSSYKSIQAFADKAKAELPQVDALLLNAGMVLIVHIESEGSR